MLSTSTLPQYSHPKNNFSFYKKQRIDFFSNGRTKNTSLCYCFMGSVFPFSVLYKNSSTKYLYLKRSSIVAAASSSGSRSSRKVYKQSQAQAPAAPIQGIASFVLPAGAFVVVTFGIPFTL
ncbi:uncharacterized protein LOC111386805 [Olea europaea var. sylvestris]|uniref:uncharacterized protein LOC111386805 n=1 Tax=Olea europaea var. sylvestris TaxID=158386 RepID=UPI000C1D2A4A|nr:uncharacterized protein LOC111386805 [Olea europaea var. sylvestris]